MFKTNEYFDGKVMSIAITTADGPATIGAMAAGEYEFGTSTREYMTVTSGVLTVKLPDSESWVDYGKGQTFIVEKDKKFGVKAEADASYLCLYE